MKVFVVQYFHYDSGYIVGVYSSHEYANISLNNDAKNLSHDKSDYVIEEFELNYDEFGSNKMNT